jgi:predicted signal transduction protein with EAL and GGDEF domain
MVSFDDGAIHTLRVADDLLELLRKPYTVGHETLYLSASIGVATFPMDGRDPDELIRNAAIAMERAKSEGKNRYSLFTDRTDEVLLRRLRLETENRNGIDAGEVYILLPAEDRCCNRES